MSSEWPEEEDDAESSAPSGFDARAAIGGAAAMLASERLLAPLMDIPDQRYDALAAKRPILSPAKTPLQNLAEFTRAEVDAIAAFAKKQGVTAPIISAGPGAGSSYVTARPLSGKIDHIGLGRASVPSAMHEIGHATPILGSPALRDTSFLANAMSRGAPGKILRGLLAANILRGKQEGDSSTREALYDYAPAAIGATYAPTLLEEARATGHAVKGGKAIGKGMATLKDLLPGYGTYAAKAMTPVLAALVAKKVVEALRGMGKVPEQEKEAAFKTPNVLKLPATAAWRMHPPRTKSPTTSPNRNVNARAKETPKLKPRSNVDYHKDVIESYNNPARGFRDMKPS